MPPRKKSKEKDTCAQWIITYYCPRCDLEFGGTEVSEPYCFYCKRGDGLLEKKRERASKAALVRHLSATTDRMMESLLKAHTITTEAFPDDAKKEISGLRLLASGENLKKMIRRLSVKEKRKSVK